MDKPAAEAMQADLFPKTAGKEVAEAQVVLELPEAEAEEEALVVAARTTATSTCLEHAYPTEILVIVTAGAAEEEEALAAVVAPAARAATAVAVASAYSCEILQRPWSITPSRPETAETEGMEASVETAVALVRGQPVEEEQTAQEQVLKVATAVVAAGVVAEAAEEEASPTESIAPTVALQFSSIICTSPEAAAPEEPVA